MDKIKELYKIYQKQKHKDTKRDSKRNMERIPLDVKRLNPFIARFTYNAQ